MAILSRIESPADLQALGMSELYELAAELRAEILRVVSVNAGHLASNLGAVELTIALHRAFESPRDAIVWDVGHQTYAHKLLTGRRDAFPTIRTLGGLCGFPRRDESEHDAFAVGHASTALSASLGIARGRRAMGTPGHVIAVVGDGAFTGGMCYEALNDAGLRQEPLIAVLNDNEMSISRNVGALSTYLTALRSNPRYWRIKNAVSRALLRVPLVGKAVRAGLDATKNMLRYLLVPGEFFEALGWKYLGPIDGHDIVELERVFARAKELDRPVFIHVVTRKGRGYAPAEKRPDRFHGVSPFDVRTGQQNGSGGGCARVVGDALSALRARDARICAVIAAMGEGTGISVFQARYPEQTYDVGIAEEHAVTMAAGLAAAGMRPYVGIYSTFLQRAYDQIWHDVCLQNLPVTFLLDRAGLGGEDGATHHGVYDMSFLRMPNMTVLAPRDERELRRMIAWAATHEGPVAIRYPKGLPEAIDAIGGVEAAVGETAHHASASGGDSSEASNLDSGTPVETHSSPLAWQTMQAGDPDAPIVLSVGRMTAYAQRAVDIICVNTGRRLTLIDAPRVHPLDDATLHALANRALITIEDNVLPGGFGEAVLAWRSRQPARPPAPTRIIGVPDAPQPHGASDALLRGAALDPESLAATIQSTLEEWNR